MYLSKLFLPLLKETPSEAKIKSHQLMLRAGMIRQSSTGIYSWLPLGFKVMKKIEQIVREEQNKIGAQELLMPEKIHMGAINVVSNINKIEIPSIPSWKLIKPSIQFFSSTN